MKGRLVVTSNRTKTVQALVCTDTHEASARLALSVPLCKGRREFLERHTGVVEREIGLVCDAHLFRLANPQVSLRRIPCRPLWFDLAASVPCFHGECYPVRIDNISVHLEHLFCEVDCKPDLAFPIDHQYANAPATLASLLSDHMQHDSRVFSGTERQIDSLEVIERERNALLGGLEYV
ncbi:hypothetical protein D3C85_1106970 [compost metagenome]